jgi:hypothetical protein
LKSSNEIFLAKRVIDEHDKLSRAHDVFVPASQSGHSPVPCFGFSEKSLVVVICPRNVRVVVASKKASPKTLCVAHEVIHHGLVSLCNVRLLYPV